MVGKKPGYSPIEMTTSLYPGIAITSDVQANVAFHAGLGAIALRISGSSCMNLIERCSPSRRKGCRIGADLAFPGRRD